MYKAWRKWSGLVVGAFMAAAFAAAMHLASVPVYADHVGSHATPCDAADTVGGGTLAVSPSPGAGWDVGDGQCNGSFTVTADPNFPSDSPTLGGNGIELGMRAEQRRVGQVANISGDYEVLTGDDPGTGGERAWWNFQHSIAYDGNIDDLDSLTFVIRTDAGTSVPVGPVDMLGLLFPPSTTLRDVIDDRHAPKATITYSDIYQTSQNPVFGWFSSYDMDEEGAWTLSLIATKNGRGAHVSICVHTPNESCDPPPSKDDCKKGGWADFGFRNQGQCVSTFN